GRLFALGAPAPAEPVAPPVEVTALCSYDDPWLGPVERARWPGATTVAIRGYGRLGLLHAPYVYELLREHLLSPAGAPPRSWKSAAS
ncbi:MAG TPA: hypothetical protein VNO26_04450, partial [Candidatus Limnocylindria bacterium]|nr:hypothetical protein [Candidatus Limnocylindria bacterium]